ncbi:MAG: FG-GAP repeat protein, partial [Phycisphaerae bacterium]|nr:FG-GAP repeat protein [Phycisphaerae bacterium]
AISGDTIVVGSYRDDDAYSSNVLCNSGSAYVFCRCGSQWEQQAKLLPSTTSCDDEFGSSVAVSGDTVVVGSANDRDNKGYAFVFERPADGWRNMTPTARLFGMGLPADAQFGKSVAVSGDMVVVGVWGDDEKGARSGSACVFKKPECGWSGSMFEIGKLLASDGESGDRLGYSVGVSGSIAVAGAPRVTVYAYPHYWSVGRAYVFHGISDCNANDLLDTSELSPGTDCNANNVLDECEVFYPGDLNGDGVLNLGDYSNFHECVTDPCESPPCEPRLYEDPCCAPADIDSDGDVDLLDFAALQTLLAKR